MAGWDPSTQGQDTSISPVIAEELLRGDLVGKMSANVFTNNSMGEGMGVNVLEMGINISTDFKGKVCYISQTA